MGCRLKFGLKLDLIKGARVLWRVSMSNGAPVRDRKGDWDWKVEDVVALLTCSYRVLLMPGAGASNRAGRDKWNEWMDGVTS